MKSMSKQCDIVRDILPLYVDGACSEASAEMVKEHLNACAAVSYTHLQRLGRELMTTSEITTMPGDKCIMQLRGCLLYTSRCV